MRTYKYNHPSNKVGLYCEVNTVNIQPINYTDVDLNVANLPAITTIHKFAWDKCDRKSRAKYENMTCAKDMAIMVSRCPASFDTETTTVNKTKKLRNGKEKVISSHAYVYKWQFGLDDVIIHGRTWDEYRTLIDNIYNNNVELDRVKVVRVFVANLGFDFQFMAPQLIADGWTCKVFAKDQRKPLSAAFIKYNFIIEFVDALQISNSNLESLAKLYNLPSKKKAGDLDYSKLRNSKTPLTDEEIGYCSFDCRVLNDFYEWIYLNYVDNKLPFPLTSTGLVRHDTKTLFKRFETVKKGKKSYKTHFAQHTLPEMFPETYNEYLDLMDMCYSGGFTHANVALANEVLTDVNGVDFTSSYPYTIMFQKFPMTPFFNEPNATTLDDIEKLNAKGFATKFKVRFTNLETTTTHSTISISKTYEYIAAGKQQDVAQDIMNAIVDNGRIVHADTCTIYITDLDWLQNLKQFYTFDTAVVTEVQKSKYDYLPDYVRYACALFYTTKSRLKRAGLADSSQYKIAKAMVNSVYGMMVQRINVGELAYDNDTHEWIKSVEYDPSLSYEDNAEIAYQTALWGEDRKNFRQFLSPYWGVWVTAHARGNLLTTLRKIDTDAIYCDTDSIYYRNVDKYKTLVDTYNAQTVAQNNKIVDEWNNQPNHADLQLNPSEINDLGTFDPIGEHGNYTRFKTLGAKRYLKEGPEYNKETKQLESTVIATIAGLPKKILPKYCKENNIDPFDFFTNGMSIKNCKKCHQYNDEPHSDIITDEFGNTEEMTELASVGIYDIDFSLKLTSDYMGMLQAYAITKARDNFNNVYKEIKENEEKKD